MATSALTIAIQNGTFPDSEEILSSNLSSIPELLKTISLAKAELNQDIRTTSKSLAGVDEWIAQAAKVQRDIQLCKVEARKIVENHDQVKSKQDEADEASNKSELLEKEIAFTRSLQSELRGIATLTQELRSIEDLLLQGKSSEAAIGLSSMKSRVAKIKAPQVHAIFLEYQADIDKKTRKILEADLDTVITVQRSENRASLQIGRSDDASNSIRNTLKGLQVLNSLDDAAKTVTTKVETFVVEVLQNKHEQNLASHELKDGQLQVQYDEPVPKVSIIVSFARDFLSYLHTQLPQELVDPVTQAIVPKILSVLISEWFNPGIPTEISCLDDFDLIRADASNLAQSIDTYGFKGAALLARWLEQSPRTWLTKRKAETLDGVRHIFVVSKGVTHQVERVERQKVSTLDKPSPVREKTDDWNTSWDDEQQSPENNKDTEDTSGWGFDDDDENSETTKIKDDERRDDQVEDEDVGDAWGWDEDNENDKKPNTPAKITTQKSNGDHSPIDDSQELVLTEYYAITDIPDHLVEVIGRDIQDALSLQTKQHLSLNDIPASSGLLALPTLALAMFRATAATHYTSTPNLSNMNLYNDAIYVADKLQNLPPSPSVPADTAAMLKFARSAYAREMDTQRTILNDLLDGAQGFSNCTQFPYSQEITNAVTSTIDRLRTVHASWQPILSTSALLQSVGALLNTTIQKFLTDVSELEDISEAQSHRLASFVTQFTSLEDLFLATPPSDTGSAAEAVPMTAVYVPLWLKLQYLAQILDSSLVDIKYLWTEGELSLEFTAEEVVDLIEALFAESGHRRSAIAAVKAGR